MPEPPAGRNKRHRGAGLRCLSGDLGLHRSIAELYEIACELKQQAEIRANSERVARVREEWRHNLF